MEVCMPNICFQLVFHFCPLSTGNFLFFLGSRGCHYLFYAVCVYGSTSDSQEIIKVNTKSNKIVLLKASNDIASRNSSECASCILFGEITPHK